MMVGKGAIRTQDCVMYNWKSKKAGADFLLVNSSPYGVPRDLENPKYATPIDLAADLPIMLYNYAGRTETHMGEDFLVEVVKSASFCGIKESSGNNNLFHLLTDDYLNISLYYVWTIRRWGFLRGVWDAGFAGFLAGRRLSQLRKKKSIVLLDSIRISEGISSRNSGFMIDLTHDISTDSYAGDVEQDVLQTSKNRNTISFSAEAAKNIDSHRKFLIPMEK